MTKLILVGILALGTMVYLGTYEGFNLLYFEENTADRYASYGAIPLLVYLAVALFVDKYKHSIKDNKLVDATSHAVTGVAGTGLLYYFILVPVISGTIVWTNDILATKRGVVVSGIVVDKTKIDGLDLSEYELTIRTDSKVITWDTDRIETSKYKIGDKFTMEMRVGFWGLLTKDK